jgi:phosphoenolpyruvate-protein phosphotransferase
VEEEALLFRRSVSVIEERLWATHARMIDRVGSGEASIFEAHAMFVADPEIERLSLEQIGAGLPADRAVVIAFDHFAGAIAALDDPYLSARAVDLVDVRDQLVAAILGAPAEEYPSTPFVLLAQDVTPSQTASIDPALLLAIVCERGSEVTHAAILARSLGIPAVVGVGPGRLAGAGGVTIAVDGRSGEVLIEPSSEQLGELRRRAEVEREHQRRVSSLAAGPAITLDGKHIIVAANVNGPNLLNAAAASGADGSGLIRSEFLFLGRSSAPDLDEQEAVYRRQLEAFGEQLVIIRTLDIGADKPVPYIDRAAEPNPALGLRGLRLGLAMPELLQTQLQALVRASSSGRLGIMFPMVSSVAEVHRVRALIDSIATAEGVDRSSFQVGTMIEVPAAALAADRIAPHLDFLSLGTNDLLQYAFAADRQVTEVAAIPDLFDPGMLRLIQFVATSAHAAGVWLGVCGEAASDPLSAAALVAAGADELSMSPVAVAEIKQRVRSWTISDLEVALARALAGPDGAHARVVFAPFTTS